MAQKYATKSTIASAKVASASIGTNNVTVLAQWRSAQDIVEKVLRLNSGWSELATWETEQLVPDRKQLAKFVGIVFKHADDGNRVSLRSFRDDTTTFEMEQVSLGQGDLVEAAMGVAYRAANAKDNIVFAPPIATFVAKGWQAREVDLEEGLVISVECDTYPARSRERLEKILGSATCVVASGGEWTNPETNEVVAKLHLHWVLRKAARGDALAKLKEARQLACDIAGADHTTKPINHPLRWPGSWHRKAAPKLCRIVESSDHEIDLDDALAALQAAAPQFVKPQEKAEVHGGANWGEEIKQVLSSESYHQPLRNLAMKLVISGMNDGAAVNMLRGLMKAAEGEHDKERWQVRYDDIPRAVSTARDKLDLESRFYQPSDNVAPKKPPDIAPAGKVSINDLIARQKAKDETARENSKAGGQTAPKPPPGKTNLMQTSAEFVDGFVPPDYLIDGLLQRRYVYSFTAPTGSGKTAIALLIAAHVALGLPLAEREVEKGRVLFFAGENPDDVRTRWIMLCEKIGRDPDEIDVVFMPFTVNLSDTEIRKRIDAEAAEHGPFSLLIVDTSASFYSGDDENDNVALGNHARMLRTFTSLPGGPTILVTCHPIKTPNMENLLPRGGGAFLAEVDGNLVCIADKAAMMSEVTTHGKFRGPEFNPFSFRLVPGQSDKLVDTKGRQIWTIYAEPMTSEDVEEVEARGHQHQDDALRMMLDKPNSSLAELANLLGWRTMEGEPPSPRCTVSCRNWSRPSSASSNATGAIP